MGKRASPSDRAANTRSLHSRTVELPTPERIEQLRRSVAMLPPRSPALNREQALELYGWLVAALLAAKR